MATHSRTQAGASQAKSESQRTAAVVSPDTTSTPHEPILYKAVLAAAIHPIVTIDSRGVVQSASNAVRRVFGWTPAELIGRNVSVLMPEPHRSAHDGYLVSYFETGRTEHLDRARLFEAVHKDGTFVPVEVSVSRVDVPGQTAPLFVGIMRELGEDSEQHADGEVTHTRMGALLAEQTSALQAAHLRLRITDRLVSIGALAAGLGHDMNNVLLPVRAHLNAARAQTMKPNVRQHVEAVGKSVSYLQQLADGLHFLAVDSDNDDSERAAIDVHAWWAQTGPLLIKAVPQHVRVTASIPTGLPEVSISTHGLTQAALNLLMNAGQAVPADRTRPKGRVRIWAEMTDRGERVKLAVTDNGIGMSVETQRNAFEMFYTTKSRGLGTGLGLPLVARIVASAGGNVHIESEPGKGTTMAIVLPVADQKSRRFNALNAVITLTDGRTATLIQHLLEAAGVRATLSSDPATADIWVIEPTGATLADVKAWRKRHSAGGLVLFGPPAPDRRGATRSVRAWSSLHPVTIEDRDDLDAIRAALARAIRSLRIEE